MEKVIKKSVAVCRGQIRRKIKTFEINISKDLPVIHTDPLALEQVLVNLLINAAQAVDDGDSRVMLSAKLGKTLRDYLIIEVGDNGCGMDEETKAIAGGLASFPASPGCACRMTRRSIRPPRARWVRRV